MVDRCAAEIEAVNPAVVKGNPFLDDIETGVTLRHIALEEQKELPEL